MRAFPVPVQLDSEERVIGGLIAFRQLIYIIAGLAIGGGVAAITRFLPLSLRIVLCVLFILLGVGLAFIHINDTDLDVYLFRYFKWRISHRKYYLKGDE